MARYIESAEWAGELDEADTLHRVLDLHGGRSSGKTWETCRYITRRGAREPGLRVMCAREHQASIAVSAKPALEKAIRDMGLEGSVYQIYEKNIRIRGGGVIDFRGMAKNPMDIKGWEGYDLCWVEEAQNLSQKCADILMPTIRKPGNNVIFTWNPQNRTDWVYKRMILNPQPSDWSRQVNWDMNPWFSREMNDLRLEHLRDDPELYRHIWEGEPMDEGADKRVMPYALVRDCVEAFRQNMAPAPGAFTNLGFDVADTGADKNSFVIRNGPTILDVDEWKAHTTAQSTRHVHKVMLDNDVKVVYYDSQGVGAGARGEFDNIRRKTGTNMNYMVIPIAFGGEVKGKDRKFDTKYTNGEFFLRRNSQMAWTLRLRAMNTRKLLRGGTVDVNKCLFINDKIEKKRLEKFMAQLSQPKWDTSELGRLRIVKKELDEPSPDMSDAAWLSFAGDSQDTGLRV